MAIAQENHSSAVNLEQDELFNPDTKPNLSYWDDLDPLKEDVTEASPLIGTGDGSDAGFKFQFESEDQESDALEAPTGNRYYSSALKLQAKIETLIQKVQAKIETLIQKKEINPSELTKLPEISTLFDLFDKAYKTAGDHFTRAYAGYQVMYRLEHGIGVQTDKKQAYEIRKAIGPSFVYVLQEYFDSRNIQNSLKRCVEICEFLLKEDSPDYIKALANFYLGICYEKGDDQVKKNHESAMRYFQKAAQFVDPKIQFYSFHKLFLMNHNGWIGNDGQQHVNIEKARKYYAKMLDLIEIDPNGEAARQINAAQLQPEKNGILSEILWKIISHIHTQSHDTPIEEAESVLQMPNTVEVEVAAAIVPQEAFPQMDPVVETREIESDFLSCFDFLNRFKTVERHIAHLQHHQNALSNREDNGRSSQPVSEPKAKENGKCVKRKAVSAMECHPKSEDDQSTPSKRLRTNKQGDHVFAVQIPSK